MKRATFFLTLQIKINQRDLFDYSIKINLNKTNTHISVHMKLNVERVDLCHINHRLNQSNAKKNNNILIFEIRKLKILLNIFCYLLIAAKAIS